MSEHSQIIKRLQLIEEQKEKEMYQLINRKCNIENEIHKREMLKVCKIWKDGKEV